jgi:hypothetical protein
VSVYVLVAIVKKRLALSASLYEILQILSLTMFERIPLDQLLLLSEAACMLSDSINQLNLFEKRWDTTVLIYLDICCERADTKWSRAFLSFRVEDFPQFPAGRFNLSQ